jgi:hypothetical protein
VKNLIGIIVLALFSYSASAAGRDVGNGGLTHTDQHLPAYRYECVVTYSSYGLKYNRRKKVTFDNTHGALTLEDIGTWDAYEANNDGDPVDSKLAAADTAHFEEIKRSQVELSVQRHWGPELSLTGQIDVITHVGLIIESDGQTHEILSSTQTVLSAEKTSAQATYRTYRGDNYLATYWAAGLSISCLKQQ